MQSGNLISLGYFTADGNLSRALLAASSVLVVVLGAFACSILILWLSRHGRSYPVPVLFGGRCASWSWPRSASAASSKRCGSRGLCGNIPRLATDEEIINFDELEVTADDRPVAIWQTTAVVTATAPEADLHAARFHCASRGNRATQNGAGLMTITTPLLILMCGLSFYGKSTLALELLRSRLDTDAFSLDVINAERGLYGGQGMPDDEWQHRANFEPPQNENAIRVDARNTHKPNVIDDLVRASHDTYDTFG